ncbi:MAG: hypothetical protein KAS32_01820 [Candidatus Peribacteraceae bacterium]|nr:hypothetical protein [Candidatus Peribacteraceae bacterium]
MERVPNKEYDDKKEVATKIVRNPNNVALFDINIKQMFDSQMRMAENIDMDKEAMELVLKANKRTVELLDIEALYDIMVEKYIELYSLSELEEVLNIVSSPIHVKMLTNSPLFTQAAMASLEEQMVGIMAQIEKEFGLSDSPEEGEEEE